MAGSLIASSQKGSLLLAEIRRKYPNYHPIMAMVDLAHHEDASLELQFNCHKTVAKYVEPELKSIEVKGEMRNVQQVRVSLFDESNVQDVGFSEIPFSTEEEVNQSVGSF